MQDPLKLEAQFNRASISSKDFAEAEDFLNAYRDDLSEILKRALLVSAVVAYARPFTSNEGGAKGFATSRLVGNPKQVLSNDEFILHENILGLRNEAVAHSDYDRKSTRLIEKVGPGFLIWSKPFDILSETIPITTFLTMCKKMKNHCTDMLLNLSRSLGGER